ncbi:polysaccharide biosynthesis tyrosine autokinase [Sulfurovum sp.]|uniref:GumC family protein n=1 Tax=Sulfurovum sp. TaxID=1969726 RepID=UPI002867EE52|nr:polysaccharide biosynthesis tyrosine autokinase [Sulfurovum sp.]
MHSNNDAIDRDEIDIKEVFRTIKQYWFMIISIVIIFAVASAYYAYFKPNIYSTSATVEVGLGQRSQQDVLSMAIESGSMNAMTEIEIIKSRFLAEKALKKVNFTHRYYTTRNFKEIEVYTDAPFQVGMLKGYGISFDFYPIDEKSYRLSVSNAVDINGISWDYDETLSYGKEVETEYFHLNIRRTKSPEDNKYRFVIAEKGSPQGGVAVSQRGRYSTILQVSYTDNVALRAQEYTNALTEAYIEQNIEKKTKEATRKLAFIDKQLKSITENLKSSALKVEEFKKTSNTIDLSSKAEAIIERMANYETQLAEISIEEEMLSGLYSQMKSGQNLETISIVGISSAESAVASMISNLQAAVIEKQIMRQDYTEMYPGMIKLKKQIVQLKQTIIETIKNLRKSIEEKKVLIERSILNQQKLLNKLPANQRMFGQLQRKFVINEKIYTYLLEKRLETAVVKASTVSKNRILDRALTPEGAFSPKRKMIVLVGVLIGLILGMGLAFLRAFMDDRIKMEDDITKVTDVPLLGMIPNIKEDHDKVKVFISPKSAISESFRNLRTNLQFMSGYKQSHVIAITSTVGGEGKTTICINLGAIMSMAEKKTIILNLDMRKPTLHEKFGLNNIQGMSTLLSGSTSLGEVIQHTEYANLDVITSGPVPPNPSELIQTELMEMVLKKLKEIYDVIILDTPPVGLVTDARTLMHHADTSMYVLRAGYSKKTFLRSIKDLSSLKEIHGLSILLNDVKLAKDGYGYGYGYGSSYGYYEEDEK